MSRRTRSRMLPSVPLTPVFRLSRTRPESGSSEPVNWEPSQDPRRTEGSRQRMTVPEASTDGVTSAIEALQSRMTAVEQKNTTQDSQISALDSRVKAIEDTPGVGQFGAGKLGTIAGSTADGRVKAEDDGTGSVNGWSDLKSRVSTAEGQIVTAQNDISDIKTKNTQQDSAISGLESSKVSVAQGVENAGKALVVGADGNVTPKNIGGRSISSLTLAQAFTYNSNSRSYTVNNDTEIEFFCYNGYTLYTARVLFPKGTYVHCDQLHFKHYFLVSTTGSNTFISFEMDSGQFFRTYFVNNGTTKEMTQITSESVPAPTDQYTAYYRLLI